MVVLGWPFAIEVFVIEVLLDFTHRFIWGACPLLPLVGVHWWSFSCVDFSAAAVSLCGSCCFECMFTPQIQYHLQQLDDSPFLQLFYCTWIGGNNRCIWNWLHPADHLQVAVINSSSFREFHENLADDRQVVTPPPVEDHDGPEADEG